MTSRLIPLYVYNNVAKWFDISYEYHLIILRCLGLTFRSLINLCSIYIIQGCFIFALQQYVCLKMGLMVYIVNIFSCFPGSKGVLVSVFTTVLLRVFLVSLHMIHKSHKLISLSILSQVFWFHMSRYVLQYVWLTIFGPISFCVYFLDCYII